MKKVTIPPPVYCLLCPNELLENEDGICHECAKRRISVRKRDIAPPLHAFDDDHHSRNSHTKRIDKPNKTRYNAIVRKRKQG